MIDGIPPALILMAGALLVPLFKGAVKQTFLLLLPVAAFWSLISLPEGASWIVRVLEYDLVLAEVDKLSLIFGYIFLLITFIGILFALPVWVTPTLPQLFWLFIVGASGLSAHYCTARALALADATVVVPMDFMRLPLIVLVGFLLYSETAEPLVLLGAVMIFAGNYYSIRREHQRRAHAPLS